MNNKQKKFKEKAEEFMIEYNILVKKYGFQICNSAPYHLNPDPEQIETVSFIDGNPEWSAVITCDKKNTWRIDI